MLRAFRQLFLSLFVVTLSFVIFAVTSEDNRYLTLISESMAQVQKMRARLEQPADWMRRLAHQAHRHLSSTVDWISSPLRPSSSPSDDCPLRKPTRSRQPSQTKVDPVKRQPKAGIANTTSAPEAQNTPALLSGFRLHVAPFGGFRPAFLRDF